METSSRLLSMYSEVIKPRIHHTISFLLYEDNKLFLKIRQKYLLLTFSKVEVTAYEVNIHLQD